MVLTDSLPPRGGGQGRGFSKISTKTPETDLYAPIKSLLEGQGYEVKGEIGPADIVAIRADEPPLIVELKTGFSLSLIHQAIARLTITDTVYVAVPRKPGRAAWAALKNNKTLCRRLGLGLITVRLEDGHTEIICDPSPYTPRKNARRQTHLLREFAKREGDPNQGGMTRQGLVTAYRQDALKLAAHLATNGPTKASEAAKATGVVNARNIMADDHYGWFTRIERGIYTLTEEGKAQNILRS